MADEKKMEATSVVKPDPAAIKAAEKATAAPAEEATEEERKPYVLKEGAVHHVIEYGESVRKVGDGSPRVVVMLTVRQASAISDKLMGELDETTGNITYVAGEETGGKPTIVEGAASLSPKGDDKDKE